jgi:hypothetical protein
VSIGLRVDGIKAFINLAWNLRPVGIFYPSYLRALPRVSHIPAITLNYSGVVPNTSL